MALMVLTFLSSPKDGFHTPIYSPLRGECLVTMPLNKKKINHY